MKLDAKIPAGPLAQKWDQHRFDMKLVNPANKRKFDVIVVGTGLGRAPRPPRSLAELGYNVKAFCYQDSPRRAHSIAAQGGINAAKNYQNDGDSVYRLFYDTIKGGDFRAREANVYRLAQVSVNIIDQCVAQGVPFAREYGGLLANRSFGGAQVSRTFYARGQTGQQLLLGAYQALCRQIAPGQRQNVSAHRNARPGRRQRPRQGHHRARPGHRRNFRPRGRRGGAGHRRLRQRFLSFHQRQGLQRHRHLARLQEGRGLRQSLLHADSSHLHPRQRRSSIQAHPHVRIACATTAASGCPRKRATRARRATSRRRSAIIIWNANIPASATWPRATSPPARPRKSATRAAASGRAGAGVYLDFADAIQRLGEAAVRERYGNLFDMYEKITGENAYQAPMRIYPAVHYTMGGLWVDYNLMSTVPGSVCAGRGEFFRSRRQPPRRQRPDAGPGRRLFHRCPTPWAIISPPPSNPSRARTSRNSKRPWPTIADADPETARPSTASAPSIRSTRNWAPCSGKNAAWPATKRA